MAFFLLSSKHDHVKVPKEHMNSTMGKGKLLHHAAFLRCLRWFQIQIKKKKIHTKKGKKGKKKETKGGKGKKKKRNI